MAFTGMTYDQFAASQKKKGITIKGGDGSYNRYTQSYGLSSGLSSNQNNSGIRQVEGIHYDLSRGASDQKPNMLSPHPAGGARMASGFSPGANLLDKIMSPKKRGVRVLSQDYNDGSNLPAGVYMVSMGGMGKVRSDTVFQGDSWDTEGRTMTAAELVNKRVSGANGLTFDGGMATDRYGDEAWRVAGQNFAQASAPQAPAASGGGGARAAAPAAPAAPKQEPISDGEIDFVTPPASGLEDTIRTGRGDPPVNYLDPDDNAPGSGYGKYKPRRSFLTPSDEKKERLSFLNRS